MFKIAYQYINCTITRGRELRKALKDGKEIAEAVEEIELVEGEKILVLLCLKAPQVISHIAWGRKGNRAATNKSRLNFDRIEELQNIDVKEILEDETWSEYHHFINAREVFTGSDDCEDFINKLRENFPEINDYIEQSLIDYQLIDQLSYQESLIIRQEHDATEMALRFAEMTPRRAYKWSPSKQNAKQISSFFSGISPAGYDEDDIVRWELDKIPGFKTIQEHVFGHYVLQDGRHTLHTFHANKNALEHTMGVDLVYFNEEHKNFVFIQYKMAEPQDKTHIFRFPDKQLTKEIDRMDRILKVLENEKAAQAGIIDATDFRITNDPFFLKFCPRSIFDPDANEQVRGMIIPLEMWKIVEQDNRGVFVGPKNGKLLSFENCPRWFDNTTFISLLKEGWIGTSQHSQQFVEQVVTEIINSKNSLILASKLAPKKETPKPKRKRKRKTSTRKKGEKDN